MHQMQLGMSWRGGGGGICKKSGNAAANHGLYGVPEPSLGKERKIGNVGLIGHEIANDEVTQFQR